jgi:hypothetical protein
VAASGVLEGEARQTTRRGREAQRGPLVCGGERGQMLLWGSLVRVLLGNPRVEFRTLTLARG